MLLVNLFLKPPTAVEDIAELSPQGLDRWLQDIIVARNIDIRFRKDQQESQKPSCRFTKH